MWDRMELLRVVCGVGLLVRAGQTHVPHRSQKDQKLHWRGRQLPFCCDKQPGRSSLRREGLVWIFLFVKGTTHHGGEDMAAGG